MPSAHASIKPNWSLRGLQDLTGARALLLCASKKQDEAGALSRELLIVQLRILRRRLRLIQQLQQVCLAESYYSQKKRLTFSTAAAAAKINAQIQAKKGIQHVDVPPIRSTLSPGEHASPKASIPGVLNSASTVNGEMYIADGDYIKDIEVNDLRNRYTLTKGATQKMVNTSCVNIPLIYQAVSRT